MMVSKPMSTGALLYAVGVTIIMLYFIGQWRMEKAEARSSTEALYAVCRGVEVLAPHLIKPPPMPTTPAGAMAQATDTAFPHRSRVARICNDENNERFDRIRSREQNRQKS